MERSPLRDLVVGLFVLAGLAAIAYLSFTVGGVSYAGPGGLTVYAAFDELGGLGPRSPVVISGVKVGHVTGIELGEDFRARVEMDVDARLKLPVDSTASIVTAGLLGDKYMSLQLGGEEELLESGGELTFTESAVILENLLGKFIYGTGGGTGAEGEAAKSPRTVPSEKPADAGEEAPGA